MPLVIVYLFQRLWYQVRLFVYDWYVGGFRAVVGRAMAILAVFDRFWALKITLRYWTKPLYQDQSFLGHALGFVFRTTRLLCGGLLYAVILAVAFCLYAAWAAVPLFIAIKAIHGNP